MTSFRHPFGNHQFSIRGYYLLSIRAWGQKPVWGGAYVPRGGGGEGYDLSAFYDITSYRMECSLCNIQYVGKAKTKHLTYRFDLLLKY